MRPLLALSIFFVIALATPGCGPAISEKDLGTVVYEIPKVKAADQPYEMPELGPLNEEHQSSNETEEE